VSLAQLHKRLRTRCGEALYMSRRAIRAMRRQAIDALGANLEPWS
jgi:hypothetical protein